MLTPYDHPDYHAFVRAMRMDDSDLIRGVVADWLEERGEYHRASYIRSRSHDRYPYEHPSGLGAGSMSLVHEGGFPVDIELAPSLPRMQFTTAGGFVTAVRCPLADWLTHGPDLCRRHPVKEVTITDREPKPNTVEDSAVEWWGWYVVGELAEREDYDLPETFWPHMSQYAFPTKWNTKSYQTRWSQHDTRENAVAALNTAALRWAEAEADRPAIAEDLTMTVYTVYESIDDGRYSPPGQPTLVVDVTLDRSAAVYQADRPGRRLSESSVMFRTREEKDAAVKLFHERRTVNPAE